MEESGNNKNKVKFGTLGSVSVTKLESDAPDIYAKYPSTAPGLMCPDGSWVGTGGANFDDDTTCPTPSPGPGPSPGPIPAIT